MESKTRFWAGPSEAVLVITLLLVVFGAITVFSASFVLAGQLFHDSYYFIKRHFLTVFLGLMGLFITAKLGYRRVIALVPVLLVATVALLVAVHFLGEDANGARRWIRIFIKFQPSELAKLAVILLSAAYLGTKMDRSQPISLFSLPVYINLALSFIVLRQPDMGTAAVMMGLCLTLYLIAGIPRQEFFLLSLGGSAVIVYLIFAVGYRAERVLAWMDPWQYPLTSGYQVVQSLLAIGSGGFWGTGLGRGGSKFYYLPEAHTDFAFAVLCQEMGFIGAAVVLVMLAAFTWYAVKIAMNASDSVGMLLASGVIILVLGQAVGNIAMVTGLFPVTGIPLPFISYGGTSLVVNLTAVGILISIGRCKPVDRVPLPDATKESGERKHLTLVPRR
ncbi:FtsW/RodA/SpoVE family cell cycle protein [Acetonema longum]|uniref:Probable peptidoglycan glycosyltransferase FtsW n=1 Tax=Acetonema longum DSM 6540 TaxID=1009370 RepID=F7NL11_9FIRM|nr:putative peptidoglycan glycosyltransferase FtsW [Acetonema longum]EGO63267.1 cell cycle protein [Acetonema longum DSM 6540]